jgi:hypothetical protein
MFSSGNQRRAISSVNANTANQMHFRNPWIVAWWSIAFPGFGHFMTNNYLFGFFLMSFEYIVNHVSKVNLSIFYTFIGQFEKAKEVLHPGYCLLYIVVYIFSIWDSYRRCVDLNQVYQLAYAQNVKSKPLQFSPMEINALTQKKPVIALLWSSFMPVLGYIYLHRLPAVLFGMFWWSVVLYFSHLLEGFYFSALGNFEKAKSLMDPQWLLYIPSIYAFAMYDSYAKTVENNKLFEMEQSQYLKHNYKNSPSLDGMYKNSNKGWT